MGLEAVTYISDLNVNNPTPTDPKSQGDDHLRNIKSALLATFPNVTGAVTPTHTELNYVDGVTSAIQTQLDAITTLAEGKIYLGDASNAATEVTLTGDVTVSNAGVTAIAAGAIVNADVNAAADLAWTKLAAGSINSLAVTNGSGVLTTETVSPNKGVTGHITFPAALGGLMLQWGYRVGDLDETSAAVSFSTSFSTACRAVVATPRKTANFTSGDSLTIAVSDLSSTGFTLRGSSIGTTAAGYYWFAVGF